jgi:hypothetical protein
MTLEGRHHGERFFLRRAVLAVGAAVSLWATVLSMACRPAPTPSTQTRERGELLLRSGKGVAILGVSSSQGEGRTSTLHIDYLSRAVGRAYVALAPEATEVWNEFRCLAEGMGAQAVMVRAHFAPGDGEPVTFGFLRQADGVWQKPEVRTLKSGKQVLVVRALVDQGQLFVDYVTDLPTRDVCALEPEVDEVWDLFRPLAEQSHVTKAFVSPSTAPVGGGSVSFSVSREPDGSWVRQNLCRDQQAR